MKRHYSIAKARNSLPALVHAVEAGPPIELTRRGRRVAVLLSIADYERMSRKRPDLWAAIESFRGEVDLEELDVEQVYSGIRDRSPGREPVL